MSNNLKIKQVSLKSIAKALALLVVANLATANLEAAKCPLNLIAEPVATVVGGTVTVAGYVAASTIIFAGALSMGIGYCLFELGGKVDGISYGLGDKLQKYPKSTATLVAAAATLGYLYSK